MTRADRPANEQDLEKQPCGWGVSVWCAGRAVSVAGTRDRLTCDSNRERQDLGLPAGPGVVYMLVAMAILIKI